MIWFYFIVAVVLFLKIICNTNVIKLPLFCGEMSKALKVASYFHLAETNCSTVLDESDREEIVVSKGKNKKRVGAYSFYLKNFLGNGYGGSVYKGIRDNNKNVFYAIKVIKTKDMEVAKSYLLRNEISILQELDHPNIVKLIDVLYTNNHCYLITEYCPGGDLQKYINSHEYLEWGSIIYQLSKGCQYLASKNVVHRDLKPANIFLKDGVWKIGDFGFAKKISHSAALIIEGYKVGSPLYMPLETLERNMYSIKSDSFSLGVIIYFLICRKFPYHAKDVSRLIKSTREREADFDQFEYLQIEIQAIIKGLCDRDLKSRLLISEIDFSIFLTHKSIGQINEGLFQLRHKVTEQVVLCQYINYLMKNSVYFLQDNHVLYYLMSDNLYHLTSVFEWENSKCLRTLKSEYVLPDGEPKITDELYRRLMRSLESQIDILKFREDSELYQVALEKLLEYRQIVECVVRANIVKLNQILRGLTLHQSFENLSGNKQRIDELMALIA